DTEQISCDVCGTDNEADANFCIDCGASLQQTFCEACGEDNMPHAKFCAHCGEKLV
ncbi:MAG TPA: zinc ribbon domain-containing protein, partial [candidate division Zixibacteria bacterium]|nr:zinc ribbon domain-containing protein [candidate division Zixibacteria bacterium]